ncbi:hypothetical protein MMC07_006661 [Pseudocyphellaria aurata]|nr:hypothetical protein [Pseudocyphellaria aurata]
MAGLMSSESNYAATVGNFNIDFDPLQTGDLSQRLLTDEASPPSTVTSHDLQVRQRAASSSNITEVDSVELAQSRSKSDAISPVSSEIVVERHIYWLSPALMTGLFIAGVFFAIGHHLYYKSLDGQEVGDLKRQQWPLRFGNVFSFLVKSCLAASAGIACVQWMWKTLRRSYITIEGIDAAFSAQENLLSLLNWEMLSKMRIGTFIALMTWCIPLAALITPATLSVRPTYQYIETSEKVASLNMSSVFSDFPYPSLEQMAFLEHFAEFQYSMIVGPSLPLARIASASATTGDIFRIAKPLPEPNMTYQIDLYVPAIRCENSSFVVAFKTAKAAVIAARKGRNTSVPFDIGSLDLEHLIYHVDSETTLLIGYYAEQSPVFDDNGLRRSQLRIVIADHDDDNSTKPLFLTCMLWNASSIFKISYKDDVQSVQRENFTYVNKIVYSGHFEHHRLGEETRKRPHPKNLADTAYTMFFWAICNQLYGLVSVNVSTSFTDLISSVDELSDTPLTGASEYVSMMRNFSIYYPDKSRKGTLTPAVVTYTQLRNEYSYEYHNLVLAYGLAILFTLLCIVLGWSAFISNGMSYEYTVSSIIGTAQNPDVGHSPPAPRTKVREHTTDSCSSPQLADLFRRQTPGAQPLDRQIRKTKLRFGAVAPRLSSELPAGGPGQRAAFGLEGTVSQLQKS